MISDKRRIKKIQWALDELYEEVDANGRRLIRKCFTQLKHLEKPKKDNNLEAD